MDLPKVKPLLLTLAIGAVVCVFAWKIAPRFLPGGFLNRVPTADTAPGPHAPPGSVLISITMIGFDPASIETKAGQPLKLAFFRPNEANCAREVVFPDFGIRKVLPPGQTVVVDLTPSKTGTFVFECGMKMLKGQLIVR